jgi:hypothetical protein
LNGRLHMQSGLCRNLPPGGVGAGAGAGAGGGGGGGAGAIDFVPIRRLTEF